jgi:DNA-binding LacI/PurR family transcriptional regulator
LATIKEIAEKAGVSTTTVSNVIHGKTKKVSPATIQKIEALIKEVGYVQKRGLRVLNNEKSQLIAVVINYHKEFKNARVGSHLTSDVILL